MCYLQEVKRREKKLIKKKDNQEPTVSKDKEKKGGRKSKMLPHPPAQEVDVLLVVGGISCSLLTGINANDSPIGPSIGMSSYEDATIGEDTLAQDTNDDLIRMLNDVDANEIGDGGTSDAKGDGYKCVIFSIDGMTEVKFECKCFDANEIESGVEVDNNDAFVCEVTDDGVQSRLYGACQAGHHHMLLLIGVQRSIQIKESHSLKMRIILEVGAHIRPMFEPRGGKYICHAMPAGNKGRGPQKRTWGIEMNETQETYLKNYSVVDKIDQMLLGWNLTYRSWRWWHAPTRHAKVIAMSMAYSFYLQCS